MDYLIRLAQQHETFRRPELEALAAQENVRLEILDYNPDSPFCVVRLHPKPVLAAKADSIRSAEEIAKSFASRSILARGIYELWGRGSTYDEVHEDVRRRSEGLWAQYRDASFRFAVDAFYGKRSMTQQRQIIDSFRYLGFEGKIQMTDPDVAFTVFEEWDGGAMVNNHNVQSMTEGFIVRNGKSEKPREPKRLFFGRYLGGTRRSLIEKHDLKKRPYISTTSMDAELALITATLALAAPGKIFLDPFVGTGGFMVAAAELGALTFGSDIDGRSYRGKGSGIEKGIGTNFEKYGLNAWYGDCFTSDLTNTPIRQQLGRGDNSNRWLDGITADPPYGVREGLKVLGTRQIKPASTIDTNGNEDLSQQEASTIVQAPHYINGVPSWTLPDYIAPKKPYSFTRMMNDILNFAARTLVDSGRLAFWMPSANEFDQEFALPKHPLLRLEHVCVQVFNKWSRRLLVYERIKGDVADIIDSLAESGIAAADAGRNADDLNAFRKMYFEGFQSK